MSKTAHTPGPWEKVLADGSVIAGGKIYPKMGEQHQKEGESWLAWQLRLKKEQTRCDMEKKANLRLMRKAPEMYEELKQLKGQNQ